jgi:AraC family transcriptional regulator
MPADRAVLRVTHDICRRLDGDCSMATLAARANWSAGHLHRSLGRVLGETPKQYVLRLRLERAAARLATGDEPVLDIALAVGFAGHEVFARAFRRHFATTPTAYRAAALTGASAAERARHRAVVDTAGPCLHLFHLATDPPRSTTVDPVIEHRELVAQPALFIRRRVARDEIARALGECFGAVSLHAQKEGLAFGGPPFARYADSGPGLLTIEAGFSLAAAAPGHGEIESGTLSGGPVVMAVHAGAYDGLPRTFAAIERYLDANDLTASGPPWELYVTDPGDHPDPADWRTEVYWPVAG